MAALATPQTRCCGKRLRASGGHSEHASSGGAPTDVAVWTPQTGPLGWQLRTLQKAAACFLNHA